MLIVGSPPYVHGAKRQDSTLFPLLAIEARDLIVEASVLVLGETTLFPLPSA